MTEEPEKLQLVYDAQCPVCRAYCEGIARETAVDALQLVDARQQGALMDEINARRLDIDEGMVLKADGRLFYGAAAILELGRRRKSRGLYGRINQLFFGAPLAAAVFYPLGKAFRNALLRLLGIEKIRNLEKIGPDRREDTGN